MSSHGGSVRVVLIALGANLGIAIAKFVGAVMSGSASLLAEAIHSVVDCSNQGLLLLGAKKSQRAPSELHPLGYGRETFFWSFIVSILLFSLGGMFAIYEGLHKISDREPLSSPILGLSILIVSCVLEGFSFKACLEEVRKQNTFGSLWKWFRRTTSADLLVIFTEDAAAMVGLLIATLSLVVAWVTGDSRWDALGSILVGVLLVVVAVLLAYEIKSLLIGEAPATDFRTYLEQRLAVAVPGAEVLRLIVLQIGSHEVLLSCKLTPGQVTDVHTLIQGINQVEREMKQKFPEIRWQFFEPDTEA